MQEDEIDLFELIKTLWVGKLLILVSTLVTLMCGYGYVFVKSQSPYSVLTRVDLEVFEEPAGYSSADVFKSFKAAFYSEQRLKSFVEVDDIKNISWKRAPIFRPDPVNKLMVFGDNIIPINITNDFKISVWTKNPQVPIFIERYARAVSDEISLEYIEKVKRRRGRVVDGFSKFDSLPEVAAQQIIEADDFLAKISEGSPIIVVQAPTELQPTFKRDLLLALSVVLGVFLGCASVLLRQAIRSRRPPTDAETPN